MERLVRLTVRRLRGTRSTVVTAVTCATHRGGSGARRRSAPTVVVVQSPSSLIFLVLLGSGLPTSCSTGSVGATTSRPLARSSSSVRRCGCSSAATRCPAPTSPSRHPARMPCTRPAPRGPRCSSSAPSPAEPALDRRHRARRAASARSRSPAASAARVAGAGVRSAVRSAATCSAARAGRPGPPQPPGAGPACSSPPSPSCSPSSRSSRSGMLPLWALAPAVLAVGRGRPAVGALRGPRRAGRARAPRRRRRRAGAPAVDRSGPTPVRSRAARGGHAVRSPARRVARTRPASAPPHRRMILPRRTPSLDEPAASEPTPPRPDVDTVFDDSAEVAVEPPPTSWCRSSTRTTSRSPGTRCPCRARPTR